ncbi:holo-ACP synthase [Aliamphritea spongicola]|uniref:holo-ACP synthase n=1 Tax=Aliamphritea spongicola TaxID=707589 RepID=UPI00196A2087|nr:holo-ACP synthase [Aliamphritea spongicola]MBN3564576.1 holo-ACP synthase [Aliamphritea spongicola]
MICGIGTDILEIARIENALSRTPKLANRILTPAELEKFAQSAQPARFLAKRFAAKEAAVKALGTGIGHGIGWQQFEICHNALGKPLLKVTGNAEIKAGELGIRSWHLSYSDEQAHVVAFVIAES